MVKRRNDRRGVSGRSSGRGGATRTEAGVEGGHEAADALTGGQRAPFVLLTALMGVSLLGLAVALGTLPLVPVFLFVAFTVTVAAVPDVLGALPSA